MQDLPNKLKDIYIDLFIMYRKFHLFFGQIIV